jgi:hypothetical protein
MSLQNIKQLTDLLTKQPIVKATVLGGPFLAGSITVPRTAKVRLRLLSASGNNSFGSPKGEVLQTTGQVAAVTMTDNVAAVTVASVTGPVTLGNGFVDVSVALPAGTYSVADNVALSIGAFTFPNGLATAAVNATITFG